MIKEGQDVVLENGTIPFSMLVHKIEHVMVNNQKFIPCIQELSFDLDRIFYSVMDHGYKSRDGRHNYLSLSRDIVPYDVAVFAHLPNHPEQCEYRDKLIRMLKSLPSRVYTDKSFTNIGKKYVKADKICRIILSLSEIEIVNNICGFHTKNLLH
jgi:glycyl-tRNA synthetase (class II)